MLAQTAMFVVFMLDETISQGSRNANGRKFSYVLLNMENPLKCHSDGAGLETIRVERVNPMSEQPKLW